jgi:hypothetical protein
VWAAFRVGAIVWACAWSVAAAALIRAAGRTRKVKRIGLPAEARVIGTLQRKISVADGEGFSPEEHTFVRFRFSTADGLPVEFERDFGKRPGQLADRYEVRYLPESPSRPVLLARPGDRDLANYITLAVGCAVGGVLVALL